MAEKIPPTLKRMDSNQWDVNENPTGGFHCTAPVVSSNISVGVSLVAVSLPVVAS